MKILQWSLPETGLSYDPKDGSVLVKDLSFFMNLNEDKIMMATDPKYGKGKKRLVLLNGPFDMKIASTGGHGFPVFLPPGNELITLERAKEIDILVHETNSSAIADIKSSGLLSFMSRTSICFSKGERGWWAGGARMKLMELSC